MMAFLSIAAGVAIAFLGWNLYQRFGTDRIATLNARRRTASRLVGRAEFVDGNRHLDVALALTQSTFFYENGSMKGSVDLQWVREIEYDTELATGVPVRGGRVLRLRSDSQTFEFVLPNDDVARWYLVLPPRRAKTPAAEIPIVPQVASAT